MKDHSPDILAIVRSCSVFAALGETRIRDLCGKARIETYDSRTLLAMRGETPDALRYIHSGSIDIVLSNPEGGYSSLPMPVGKWATWLGSFGSAPLVHDLWSSAQATYIALPSHDVRRAVSSSPEALREVIEHIGEWTRFLTGWMLSFAAYGPEKRLIYLLLLASSNDCAIAQEGKPTAVTQTHISQFGFGSRQKVSRLLRGLADRGLIEMRYGGVVIPSRARLEQFIAEESPRGGERSDD